MYTLIKKLYAILDPKERRNALILFLLMLVTGLVEMTGVASVIPFLAVMANPEIIENNIILAWINEYIGFQSHDSFLIFLGCSVFVIVVSGLCLNALTQYYTIRYSFMRGYSLSAKLMKAYLMRPYAWFLRQHSADLGKSILSEVEQVINGVFIPFSQLLTRSILIIFLLCLLFIVNPIVTISVISIIGFSYGFVYSRLKPYLTAIGKKRIIMNQQRFQIAQEAFGGIKEVKSGGLELAYCQSFDKPAQLFAKYQSESQIIGAVPRYIIESISFGGIILVLIALLFSHQSDLSKVLPIMGVFAFAAQRLLPAMQAVYQAATSIKYDTSILNALHKSIMEGEGNTEYDSCLKDSSSTPIGLYRCLELQGVSYKYPGAQTLAIKNINMQIRANTTVGIVGSTGAGKTTLVDIILALLPPCSGKLIVDQTSINNENCSRWRRSIGYVPQHIFLADETIASNIAFGISTDQIDQESLIRAAKLAELHDFIIKDLHSGYDTLVGERGVRLSGGQRQRIGIARALYHDPDVLIMDEATSALDNFTEQAIMDAVKALSKKKTIILIAHRLSTVKNCETIFVFDQGELKDQGSYQELLHTSVTFARMAVSR